jgi:dephospho-CoA kinase
MLKVGLTGGIATGKSYVVSVLGELGCETSDADRLAHEAIAPGRPAYEEILAAFGREILDSEGRIERARLGRIVFADAEARARLNAIVHPRVYEAQQAWFAEVEARNPDAIAVVDAALMIETGSYRRFDLLVVVHCRPELQLERLTARSGLAREDAEARIKAQMPSDEKLKYADYSIDTSGGFEDTRRRVVELYEKLIARASGGGEEEKKKAG